MMQKTVVVFCMQCVTLNVFLYFGLPFSEARKFPFTYYSCSLTLEHVVCTRLPDPTVHSLIDLLLRWATLHSH